MIKFNIDTWVKKQDKINEKVDHIDDKEAASKFDDLKDKDIDNDGDTDDSDEYLHKKLGTVAKKTEAVVNEGFATWRMQFAKMKLSGVELDPKKVYTVKARSTVEAIKKASKMAGVGDSWMATQTHKLEKIG
jgi:hypothetical protein|tara:strand:- start:734 stop:1129 length:396 start_codon:yes stop_codon:yes gene_type:complete